MLKIALQKKASYMKDLKGFSSSNAIHTLDYRPRNLLLPIYILELALQQYAMNGWFRGLGPSRALGGPLEANQDGKWKLRVLCDITEIWLLCLQCLSEPGFGTPIKGILEALLVVLKMIWKHLAEIKESLHKMPGLAGSF